MSSLFWCLNAEVTPVLIPNTEVKLGSADDTRKGKVGRRQNKILKSNMSRLTGAVHLFCFLFRKNSQKTITGLAKLQVFASHPFHSDSEACPVVSFAVLYGVKLGSADDTRKG